MRSLPTAVCGGKDSALEGSLTRCHALPRESERTDPHRPWQHLERSYRIFVDGVARDAGHVSEQGSNDSIRISKLLLGQQKPVMS